jgi:AraC family transcriptional activator of pobA
MNALVPLFALYGEEIWPADLDAIHIETIKARSALHNWLIRPHRHGDLCQVMSVMSGGGVLHLEGRSQAFSAPALMVLPAGVVHGFDWRPGSDGHVLMLGDDLVRELAPAEDRPVMERAVFVALGEELAADLEEAMNRLAAAFGRFEAGRRSSLQGGVLQVIAVIARCVDQAHRAASPISAEVELTRRFRRLIEDDFRAQPGLEAYCSRLGVTAARLARACRKASGRSPLELIHERLMVEARRALTYTAVSVSQIAYALGFSDAAYFSRFFRQREGVSPAAYRARRAAAAGAPKESKPEAISSIGSVQAGPKVLVSTS